MLKYIYLYNIRKNCHLSKKTSSLFNFKRTESTDAPPAKAKVIKEKLPLNYKYL